MIKKFILGLLAVVLVTFTNVPAVFAVGSGATEVRNLYGTSPVLTWQYSQLIASTVKGMKAVQINNTGAHAILLAFGPAGSEVPQVIVGGLQDSAVLPLSGGYANRLSVIALDGPNETGELQVNVLYN